MKVRLRENPGQLKENSIEIVQRGILLCSEMMQHHSSQSLGSSLGNT